MSTREVTNVFMQNASRCAAGTRLARTSEELHQTLNEVLGEESPVYCPRVTALERALGFLGDRVTDDMFQAAVTVEEVDAAIAETGSVVSTSAHGRAVQGSILPSHHVAIVAEDNVFATLDDFFAWLGEAPPTNVTLISGPSRTADIELTLTIGVHGPEKLDVILVSGRG
ncbi:MAG: LUD domain-containing protein [Thermodesulfobacteriota bacterium]